MSSPATDTPEYSVEGPTRRPATRVNRIRSALTRDFARHYAEMVVVMFVGMGLLALPAQWATDAIWPEVDGDDPTLMLGRMAATMTLPMIPWMRWRGHGWQPSMEMAAAMIVPAIGVIALLELGVVEAVSLLMTMEHVAMFVAMFIVMIARPHEYSHARGETTTRPRLPERIWRHARTERNTKTTLRVPSTDWRRAQQIAPERIEASGNVRELDAEHVRSATGSRSRMSRRAIAPVIRGVRLDSRSRSAQGREPQWNTVIHQRTLAGVRRQLIRNVARPPITRSLRCPRHANPRTRQRFSTLPQAAST